MQPTKTLVSQNCLIDLHLHLDGSISFESAKKLAAMQGISLPETDLFLKQKMVCPPSCTSLNDFLECFGVPLSLLQTKQAISESVYLLKEELLAQGFIYAEIRFAPQQHCVKGLTQEEVVTAALAGAQRSRLKTNFILCCMRASNNQKHNMQTVEIAAQHLNKGVTAVDLAGAEALYPTIDYAPVFRFAARLNVPYTIHAGEADGYKSVETALAFGAKRIGHGIRANESAALMQFLATNGITLEFCPTSNLCTRMFSSMEEFPLVEFLNSGIKITINTDDMTVCNNITVRDELQLVSDVFQLTRNQIKELLLNAANAAFADDETKAWLTQTIKQAYAT